MCFSEKPDPFKYGFRKDSPWDEFTQYYVFSSYKLCSFRGTNNAKHWRPRVIHQKNTFESRRKPHNSYRGKLYRSPKSIDPWTSVWIIRVLLRIFKLELLVQFRPNALRWWWRNGGEISTFSIANFFSIVSNPTRKDHPKCQLPSDVCKHQYRHIASMWLLHHLFKPRKLMSRQGWSSRSIHRRSSGLSIRHPQNATSISRLQETIHKWLYKYSQQGRHVPRSVSRRGQCHNSNLACL